MNSKVANNVELSLLILDSFSTTVSVMSDDFSENNTTPEAIAYYDFVITVVNSLDLKITNPTEDDLKT